MNKRGVKLKYVTQIALLLAVSGLLTVPAFSKDDAPKHTASDMLSLWFGGDTHFSWGVEQEQNEGDSLSPVREILPLLSRMDFRVINLESAMCAECTAMPGKYYVFNSDPRSLNSLRAMGIDLVLLGNNHSMDMGAQGLSETIKNVQSAGIGSAGAGLSEEEAGAPYLIQISGITFAVFSFNEIQENGVTAGRTTPGTISTRWGFAQRIRSARLKADHVIVSMHWGVEYATAPGQSQIDLARALIDAGADAIIGHHPHVPQGIEFYKSGVIVYSLGNFLFGSAAIQQSHNYSAELVYNRSKNRLESVRVHPLFGKFRAGGHKVRPLNSAELADFWAEFRAQCRDLNGRKELQFALSEGGSGTLAILPGS